MSLPRRRNLIPVLVALACVALTLVAANRLIHPDPNQPQGGGGGPPPAAGRGPVVLGTVTAAEPIAHYGLPETLQAGRVRKIVKEHEDVKPGTVLIEFDDTAAKNDLAKAEAAVKVVGAKLLQAQLQETLYSFDLALQELAVKAATEDYASAEDLYKRANEKFERYLSGTNLQTNAPFTDAQKALERRENFDLAKLEIAARKFASNYHAEAKKLEKVRAMKPALLTQEAKEQLVVAKADVEKARYAVESCVVKAAAAGRVGQVLAGVGAVVYPQSPPVLVVPAGMRYVRAEVEPEFAHKLAGAEGKGVIISDNNNFNLTYAGTVKQIGQAFLPKRTQGLEALAGNNSKVLEVLIEVTDPAPAGKPPLLVNQPVRVTFP